MTELNIHDLTWAVRRLPSHVRELLKKHGTGFGNIFLAGGYLRAVIAGERISDLDLFAPSKDASELCAKKLGIITGRKVHETPNAYTVFTRPIVTQFIHRWTFATPADALASFDFTIAQAAIWWNGRWCSARSDRFYQDLAAHRLVYTSPARNEDAGGSMLRVLKFYQRGYRIPLDSLGAVVARLAMGVQGLRFSAVEQNEAWLSKVLTGLLREVDPLIDPDHIAQLPSTEEAQETVETDIPSRKESHARNVPRAAQDPEANHQGAGAPDR